MNKKYSKPVSTRIQIMIESPILEPSLPVNSSKEGGEAGSNRHNGWSSEAWAGGSDDEDVE